MLYTPDYGILMILVNNNSWLKAFNNKKIIIKKYLKNKDFGIQKTLYGMIKAKVILLLFFFSSLLVGPFNLTIKK